ncbi:MAG TPA: alanine racemase [Candidatus Deferrimicrobium sp.]|nr:alanine racemase [Candidatus Deferrimicrobium sp.]
MPIIKPTFIVDKAKALRNIARIKEKIAKSPGVRFRPHFKTHQSAQTGEWFREMGVSAITVSAVDMAFYFAQHGWTDITIAVLVNPLEIERIKQLAETVDLNLLVDSRESVTFLAHQLTKSVNVWIKIDTAYQRTGIEYDQTGEILAVVKEINQSPILHFKGLLTHAGHSYRAQSAEELKSIYADTVTKMAGIREYLKTRGIAAVEISIGDTPTCSVVDTYYGVDEVRCGNFVFYDVMQMAIGSCQEEDIAAAVACPVIARYPQRNEIVIYGGAVHLSKEFITNDNEQKIFGLVALPNEGCNGWGPSLADTYVSALSQEHGIIRTTEAFIRQVRVGDIVMVLPVHSCLAADLMRQHGITVTVES